MNKIKPNIIPVWPKKDLYFSFDDLKEFNPTTVVITLRSKLTKCILNNIVVEIGVLSGGKGRPKKIYALSPVTSTMLDKAESKGIVLVEKARERLINVVSVSNNQPTILDNVVEGVRALA
jgi:hypothetical protein